MWWLAGTVVFLVGLGLGIRWCQVKAASRRARTPAPIKNADLQQLDQFASDLKDVSNRLSAFTAYLHDPYPTSETRAPHE